MGRNKIPTEVDVTVPLANPKWEVFAQSVVTDRGKHDWKRSAAIKAGYDKDRASDGASYMLGIEQVKSRIKYLLEEQWNSIQSDEGEILAVLAEQMRGDMGNFVEWTTVDVPIQDDDGSVIYSPEGDAYVESKLVLKLRPADEINTKLIKRLRVDPRTGYPDVELYDAQKAAELIGRKLGSWAEGGDNGKGGNSYLTLLQILNQNISKSDEIPPKQLLLTALTDSKNSVEPDSV